jgi:hypothetical protein
VLENIPKEDLYQYISKIIGIWILGRYDLNLKVRTLAEKVFKKTFKNIQKPIQKFSKEIKEKFNSLIFITQKMEEEEELNHQRIVIQVLNAYHDYLDKSTLTKEFLLLAKNSKFKKSFLKLVAHTIEKFEFDQIRLMLMDILKDPYEGMFGDLLPLGSYIKSDLDIELFNLFTTFLKSKLTVSDLKGLLPFLAFFPSVILGNNP